MTDFSLRNTHVAAPHLFPFAFEVDESNIDEGFRFAYVQTKRTWNYQIVLDSGKPVGLVEHLPKCLAFVGNCVVVGTTDNELIALDLDDGSVASYRYTHAFEYIAYNRQLQFALLRSAVSWSLWRTRAFEDEKDFAVRLETPHIPYADCVTFTSDGMRAVCTRSRNPAVAVHDCVTGELLHTFQCDMISREWRGTVVELPGRMYAIAQYNGGVLHVVDNCGETVASRNLYFTGPEVFAASGNTIYVREWGMRGRIFKALFWRDGVQKEFVRLLL